MITTTFDPTKSWSYDSETKTFHVSEKDLRFATEYEIVNPSTGGRLSFNFSHSTGPEFDPKTAWVYHSEDGTTLEVHNDEQMTQYLKKLYLDGKLKK